MVLSALKRFKRFNTVGGISLRQSFRRHVGPTAPSISLLPSFIRPLHPLPAMVAGRRWLTTPSETKEIKESKEAKEATESKGAKDAKEETDESKAVGGLDVSVGRFVSNHDGLLTDYETQKLQEAVAKINTKSNATLALFFVRNYNDLPKGSADECGAFTMKLLNAAFNDSVRASGVAIAYFHQQRTVQIRVGRQLSSRLTDDIFHDICKEHMGQHLISGKVYDAFMAGLPSIQGYLPKITRWTRFRTWSGNHWADWKKWNIGMINGEFSPIDTAAYGTAMGIGGYYGLPFIWRLLKRICFWTVLLFIGWRIYKYVKNNYFVDKETIEKEKKAASISAATAAATAESEARLKSELMQSKADAARAKESEALMQAELVRVKAVTVATATSATSASATSSETTNPATKEAQAAEDEEEQECRRRRKQEEDATEKEEARRRRRKQDQDDEEDERRRRRSNYRASLPTFTYDPPSTGYWAPAASTATPSEPPTTPQTPENSTSDNSGAGAGAAKAAAFGAAAAVSNRSYQNFHRVEDARRAEEQASAEREARRADEARAKETEREERRARKERDAENERQERRRRDDDNRNLFGSGGGFSFGGGGSSSSSSRSGGGGFSFGGGGGGGGSSSSSGSSSSRSGGGFSF